MLTWTGAMRAGLGRPALTWAAALAVVFALGSGEAAAQLTPDNTFDGNGLKVDVAARLAEGTSATITVTAKASVPAGTASETSVTVTVDVEPHGEHDATNEVTDVILNPGTMTLTFPANTTGSAVTHEVTGTIPLQIDGAGYSLDTDDVTDGAQLSGTTASCSRCWARAPRAPST